MGLDRRVRAPVLAVVSGPAGVATEAADVDRE